MYLLKTFRSYVAVSYEKTELRRVVTTKTPTIRMVTHEISTQTDVDHVSSVTYTTTEISEDGGATTSSVVSQGE